MSEPGTERRAIVDAGGEDGVREVIRNLRADFELTLGLAGCASVGEIGPESVQPAG